MILAKEIIFLGYCGLGVLFLLLFARGGGVVVVVVFSFCVKVQSSSSEGWCGEATSSVVVRASAAIYRSRRSGELWAPSVQHSGHLGQPHQSLEWFPPFSRRNW